ncbi:MAG: SAM-dependent methyltransferase [Parafilimonas sp.]
MPIGKVYLIPANLYNDEKALQALPAYITDAIKDCDIFFAENERIARRYFKKLWKARLPGKEMVIDNYVWYTIHNAEENVRSAFIQHLKEEKNIGIISEAGCPGIADPGQILVNAAQQLHAKIIPLVGPSSILLALMASGMNGQCFQFKGYLPIESAERKKILKELEADSAKRNCTQIFIETPYRNNQLINDVLKVCKPETLFCIAADITALTEYIQTKTINEWKNKIPDMNKRPAIFLLYVQ